MSLMQIRKNAEMSREEAARDLKVSLSTLQRWEKGKCSIPTEKVPAIAKLYKVSTQYIVNAANELKKA